MIVLVHQAVCVGDIIVPFVGMLERVQKACMVLFVFEDRLLPITAGDDMTHAVRDGLRGTAY